MALSEIHQAQVVKRLTAFCESRVPLAMHDRLRVGVRIKGEMPSAKLRYAATREIAYG